MPINKRGSYYKATECTVKVRPKDITTLSVSTDVLLFVRKFAEENELTMYDAAQMLIGYGLIYIHNLEMTYTHLPRLPKEKPPKEIRSIRKPE
jgi:hypothetical protein